MSKFVRGALVAGVVIGATALTGPAFAGSYSWGSKACGQGTIYTRATGNGTVLHDHVRNGIHASQNFYNGSTLKTNTFYSGFYVEDKAAVQNGTYTLTNPSRNCAD